MRQLAALEPDLIVNTGDNLAHPDAVPAVLETLDPLLDVPGRLRHGVERLLRAGLEEPGALPAAGLRRTRLRRTAAVDGPAGRVRRRGDGPTSTTGDADLKVRQQPIAAAGTDDAHLGLDRYADVPYRAPEDGVLRIGVTHAPYLRVVDAMAGDGFDLIFAGHTHGGQLCLPGFGALVTNCDLPVSQAKGLHARGDAWLHVSAGLGTSPTAPIRFACPPEATLLTLVPVA